MSSSSGLPDQFLVDLFREEVRTNVRTLNEGLVGVEQSPNDTGLIEPLMRAAHSIKGASRVVNVDEGVRLAHVMEELLVAAQHAKLRLTSGHVDLLLRGVDLLGQIGDAVGPSFADWQAARATDLDGLIHQLESAATGKLVASPQPAEPGVGWVEERDPPVAAVGLVPRPTLHDSATSAPPLTDGSHDEKVGQPSQLRNRPPAKRGQVPPKSTANRPDKSVTTKAATLPTAVAGDSPESVVRVTAQNLTRLMGLAGESLVEARWLPVFTNALVKLKKQQSLVSDLLDGINDSLPDSDAATQTRLLVNDARQRLKGCQTELGGRIGEFENHARQSDDLNSRLYHEVISSRMRPLSDGVHGFPRMVRDMSRQLGKQVVFEILGQSTPVDRDILEKLEAPLTHILRNAIDHGMETPAERFAAGKPEGGTLRLAARHSAGMLSISISDDGRGIDATRLRTKIVERGLTNRETASRLSEQELLEFLFLPGFSTRDEVTDVSGRGVGLDVVRSMVQSVGGTVRIQTQLGRGTTFHLQLPITLSVIRVVLVKIANEPYAFPHNRIDRLFQLPRASVTSLEHRHFCNVDGNNVGLVVGRQVFPLPDESVSSHSKVERVPRDVTKGQLHDDLNVVLFSNHTDQFGLVVDAFLGEQDLVVRTLDSRLGRVPNIQAAAILDDGSPILIVDLDDLRTSIERLLKSGKLQRTDQMASTTADSGPRRILVVDDSITVREVQRQLLTGRGYAVEVAVDGLEGWNRVREEKFDLVISDIDMPRMDGFEFVRSMKIDPQLQSTPVIIVSYKDREDDRQRGLEVGANYYLTKSSFHDESLLSAVEELIGGPEG